jgi:metallophosphoesterase (TIGR00282 family)
LDINVLFIGDVVGKPGIRALFVLLKQIIKNTKSDFIIVNGENASEGKGITAEEVNTLFGFGVDVITTGNHIWQKQDVFSQNFPNLLRPLNYPDGVPGNGYCLVQKGDNIIGVINLEGRQYMSNLRCPFEIGREIVLTLRQKTKIIIVDFHAESNEEKEALAFYLDGTASAIIGTHTHVQTADEKILSKGTGYISDIGMTGPKESIIGVEIESGIGKSLTQMPIKMMVKEGPSCISGVLVIIDTDTGKTKEISRIYQELSV